MILQVVEKKAESKSQVEKVETEEHATQTTPAKSTSSKRQSQGYKCEYLAINFVVYCVVMTTSTMLFRTKPTLKSACIVVFVCAYSLQISCSVLCECVTLVGTRLVCVGSIRLSDTIKNIYCLKNGVMANF